MFYSADPWIPQKRAKKDVKKVYYYKIHDKHKGYKNKVEKHEFEL